MSGPHATHQVTALSTHSASSWSHAAQVTFYCFTAAGDTTVSQSAEGIVTHDVTFVKFKLNVLLVLVGHKSYHDSSLKLRQQNNYCKTEIIISSESWPLKKREAWIFYFFVRQTNQHARTQKHTHLMTGSCVCIFGRWGGCKSQQNGYRLSDLLKTVQDIAQLYKTDIIHLN